jgi:hypothetical protein
MLNSDWATDLDNGRQYPLSIYDGVQPGFQVLYQWDWSYSTALIMIEGHALLDGYLSTESQLSVSV